MIDFDYFSGRVRGDTTAADIAALTLQQRTAFEAVQSAISARDSLTKQLADTQAECKTLAFAFDAAKQRLLIVQPPATFLIEARRAALPVQERMRLARLPVKPEIVEAMRATAAAEEAFESCKVRLRQLQADEHAQRGIVAAKVATFQGLFIPQTPDALIRSHLAAELQRRKDGTDKHPDEAPPASVLDAYMKSSRGPLGVRSARQANRGGYPASMRRQKIAVPSLKPWQTKKLGTV